MEVIAVSDEDVISGTYHCQVYMSPLRVSRGMLESLIEGPEFGPPVGAQLPIRHAFVRPVQSILTPVSVPGTLDFGHPVSFKDTVRFLSSLYPRLPRTRFYCWLHDGG